MRTIYHLQSVKTVLPGITPMLLLDVDGWNSRGVWIHIHDKSNIPLSLMISSESLASAGSLCQSLPSFSSRYLFDIRARRDLSNDLLGKIRSRHVWNKGMGMKQRASHSIHTTPESLSSLWRFTYSFSTPIVLGWFKGWLWRNQLVSLMMSWNCSCPQTSYVGNAILH